jgi:hypothetical protein
LPTPNDDSGDFADRSLTSKIAFDAKTMKAIEARVCHRSRYEATKIRKRLAVCERAHFVIRSKK